MQQILHPLALGPGVKAFFTSRGPLPQDSGPYDGFNVCHYTGDDPAHVSECRLRLASSLGLDPQAIVIPRQTHSSDVAVVTSVPAALTDGTDALVTRLRRVAVGVNTADCVPVVMADTSHGVIGVAHAGWRGAAAGIAGLTLAAMERLGAVPADVAVAFGPSICTECFEVGMEVARRFAGECVATRGSWPRPHVDLHRAIALDLIGRGVHPGHIAPFNTDLCTRCHPSLFHSARASGVESGRVFTFAYLE